MRRTGQQIPRLDQLPAHQRQALRKWMASLPYREIRRRLLRQFGVHTSMRALCQWYQRHIAKVEAQSTPALDVIISRSGDGWRIRAFDQNARSSHPKALKQARRKLEEKP